jgi:hypothetical protein
VCNVRPDQAGRIRLASERKRFRAHMGERVAVTSPAIRPICSARASSLRAVYRPLLRNKMRRKKSCRYRLFALYYYQSYSFSCGITVRLMLNWPYEENSLM